MKTRTISTENVAIRSAINILLCLLGLTGCTDSATTLDEIDCTFRRDTSLVNNMAAWEQLQEIDTASLSGGDVARFFLLVHAGAGRVSQPAFVEDSCLDYAMEYYRSVTDDKYHLALAHICKSWQVGYESLEDAAHYAAIAAELFAETGDSAHLCLAHIQQAVIVKEMGDYDLAISELLKAEQIELRINRLWHLTSIYATLCDVYSRKGELAYTRHYGDKFTALGGASSLTNGVNMSLAQAYYANAQYDSVIVFSERIEPNGPDDVAFAHAFQTLAYIGLKDREQSFAHFEAMAPTNLDKELTKAEIGQDLYSTWVNSDSLIFYSYRIHNLQDSIDALQKNSSELKHKPVILTKKENASRWPLLIGIGVSVACVALALTLRKRLATGIDVINQLYTQWLEESQQKDKAQEDLKALEQDNKDIRTEMQRQSATWAKKQKEMEAQMAETEAQRRHAQMLYEEMVSVNSHLANQNKELRAKGDHVQELNEVIRQTWAAIVRLAIEAEGREGLTDHQRYEKFQSDVERTFPSLVETIGNNQDVENKSQIFTFLLKESGLSPKRVADLCSLTASGVSMRVSRFKKSWRGDNGKGDALTVNDVLRTAMLG